MTALLQEIELRKEELSRYEIRTIYFGGGTPSLLQGDELGRILDALGRVACIVSDVELSLEANPDDIIRTTVKSWMNIGVNRLSIGIQSFYDEDLRYMNRLHTGEEALACIRIAQDAGIENLSGDLIFGYPLLTDVKWQRNIEKMVGERLEHISCYSMTVEPKTALSHFIKVKKELPMNQEQAGAQYEYLMDRLVIEGYRHYEISNFAKTGMESKHNSSYWDYVPYVGLGASAHSFDGVQRSWNVANNAMYIKRIMSGELPSEAEVLSRTERINERILVSLRRSEGLVMNNLQLEMLEEEIQEFKRIVSGFVAEGMLVVDDNRVSFTRNGKLIADYIMSELFVG